MKSGAIDNTNGTLTVTNSTFTGNSASGQGGDCGGRLAKPGAPQQRQRGRLGR